MRNSFVGDQKGLSLIELVMATGVGVIVFSLMANYMADTLKEHNNLTERQSLAAEGRNLFRAVELNLGNAFRLLPNEDLYLAGDGLYQGLNAVVPPKGCLATHPETGKPFPALRWTTIERRYSSEILLRPMDESVVQKTMDDAARLSYKDENGRLFRSGETFPEITIFDIDGWLVRRFRNQESIQLTTLLSPYDDLTPISPALQYTKVRLSRPPMFSGSPQALTSAKFLASSSVYATGTYVLCVSPTKKLMILDEATGESREYLNVASDNYELEDFEISYEANLTGGSIDKAAISAFPNSADKAKCIEAVRILITLKDLAGNTQRKQVLSHITSVPNFSSRQPAFCL